MLVPKASPDLDRQSLTRENYVWLAREVSPTYAEAQAKPVQSRPETNLWLGVSPLDPGHVSRSAGGVDCVGHFQPLWASTSLFTSSTVRQGFCEWTTRWQLAQIMAMSLTTVTLSG